MSPGMKSLFKTVFHLLLMVYFAQIGVSLLLDDADRWTRWLTIEHHVALFFSCLLVGGVMWAYERIKNKK